MSKYRLKIDAEANLSQGEINENPSMTIEGEYMEMKDILKFALQGGEYPKTDVQYFRPDEIQQINSLYRQSLDLTDIDSLRAKNEEMQNVLTSALERKQKEIQEQNDKAQQNIEWPENQQPKTE